MSSSRLHELDGLRGIAALWVALHHFWGAIQKRDVDWVPDWIGGVLEAGFFGVDIFFVLSGFVIMNSVSRVKVDGRFIPRFILRRSIRIDPPYWCAIAIALVLMFMKSWFFPSAEVSLPSISTVAAHFLYLQDILELKAISAVFWTLCLEFQFYMIFSVIYFLYESVSIDDKKILIKLLLFFALALCFISPIFRFGSIGFPLPGTIIPFSYEFILGVLAFFWVRGRLKNRVMLLAIGFTAISTLIYRPFYYVFVPTFVIFLLFASTKNNIFVWMKSDILLFLGRISYSFYLTHASVGWVAISIMLYLTSGIESAILTSGIFIAGIGISIIFATIFYFIIESPSLKFSKRFSVKSEYSNRAVEI